MLSLPKAILLSLTISLSAMTFTACDKNEMDFAASMLKTSRINSADIKAEYGFNIDKTSLPEKFQDETSAKFIDFLNAVKYSIEGKCVYNYDTPCISADTKVTMFTDDISFAISQWQKLDSEEYKQIIKVPSVAKFALPEGIDYFIMDYSKFDDYTEYYNFDIKKITNSTLKLQKAYIDFLEEYSKTCSIKTAYIKQIKSTSKGKVYKQEISDKQLKQLIGDLVNDYFENDASRSKVANFAGEIFDVVYEMFPDIDEDIKNQVLASMQDNSAINRVFADGILKQLENISILGDKGIAIECTTDKNGYIISQTGLFDFAIDYAGLNNLITMQEYTVPGSESENKFKFSVNFNYEYSNINAINKIDFPELSQSNSMDYFEYLKSLTPVYEPEIAAKEYTGADGEFPVIMHGQRINCKYKTFTQDSIAYMAFDDFANEIGGEISYDFNTNILSLSGYRSVSFRPGESTVNGEGITYLLSSPTKSIDAVAYIPIRSFAAIFGYKVRWDNDSSSVIIGY